MNASTILPLGSFTVLLVAGATSAVVVGQPNASGVRMAAAATAFLTGRHEFVPDADDPLRGGFLV